MLDEEPSVEYLLSLNADIERPCYYPPDIVKAPQIVRLISLLGDAIAYSTLTGEEARLLIDMRRELTGEFETFLHDFIGRIRVDLTECMTLDFRDKSTLLPLAELCEACGLVTAKPVPDSRFTDPAKRISGGVYFLAAFRRPIRSSEVLTLLEPQGYRPATLRETLLLLWRDPKLLDRHPALLVFGSGAAYDGGLIPELSKGRDGKRILRFRQDFALHPGSYQTVIAES